MSSIIAVVPARAGSTRLRNKNILPFLGHPLLAYSVAAALASDAFDKVYVSTDSELFAEVARHYGAEPIARPSEHATADAGLVGTALHAADEHEARTQAPAAHVSILMPTCPLRNASVVRTHVESYFELERVFQLSVTPYFSGYPHWAMQMAPDGSLARRWDGDFIKPSQHLESLWCPSGAVWIANAEALRHQGTFYGEPLTGASIEFERAIDINTEHEFEIAEALCLGLELRNGTQFRPEISTEPWVGSVPE